MNLKDIFIKLWKTIWSEGIIVQIPDLPEHKRRHFEKQYLAARPIPIPQLTKWLFWAGIAYWILLIRYVPGKAAALWLYPKLLAWFPLPSLLPSIESVQQKLTGAPFEFSVTAVLFLIPWALSSAFALITMCLDREYRMNWEHQIVLYTSFMWSYMQSLLKGLVFVVIGLSVAIFAFRLDWLMIPFVIKHTIAWLVVVPAIFLGLFRMPFWMQWYDPELPKCYKDAIAYLKKNAPERGMKIKSFAATGSMPDETEQQGILRIRDIEFSIRNRDDLLDALTLDGNKDGDPCSLTIDGEEEFNGVLGELIVMVINDDGTGQLGEI